MRFGIIDLGTNSVRFDVHELTPSGEPRPLFREKLMVRLGQDVFLNGKLNPDAARRTEEAFASFRSISEEIGASRIVAFGTSALREARDGLSLIEHIQKKTGIQIRILSGQDEARLIALGVLTREGKTLEKRVGTRFALIDIGGGSTEISICQNGRVIFSESFPLGTARLQQIYLQSSPPPRAKKGDLPAVEQLRRAVKSILLPKILSERWPKVDVVLGSSGTARALQKLIRKKSKKGFTRTELTKLNKKMSVLSTTKLRALPRMESKRVDMILAGSLLLEECLEALGAKLVETTEFSLRDGILEEELSVMRKRARVMKGSRSKKSLSTAAEINQCIQALTQRLSKTLLSEAEVTERIDCACSLFDPFKKICKLSTEDELVLVVSFLFLSLARKLSLTQSELLASDLISHFDLPEISEIVRTRAAEACALLPRSPRQLLREPITPEIKRTQAVLRLLSALIDTPTSVRKWVVSRNEIDVQFEKWKGAPSLPLLRFEQKKDLFEELTNRNLVVL